jgi:hypothetical protein
LITILRMLMNKTPQVHGDLPKPDTSTTESESAK